MTNNLTREQNNLVEQIMAREPRQARIDAIAKKAKIDMQAMEIYTQESPQGRIDRIVRRELEEIEK